MATLAIYTMATGFGLYTASRLGLLRALQKRWIGSTEANCAQSELTVLSKAGCGVTDALISMRMYYTCGLVGI
jgi:hypothetical protein